MPRAPFRAASDSSCGPLAQFCTSVVRVSAGAGAYDAVKSGFVSHFTWKPTFAFVPASH